MTIEELKSYNKETFEELKHLMSQLSERIVLGQTDIDRVISDDNTHMYVMYNAFGNIIATATLSIFNTPSSRKASIEDVVVHSDYRGKHLGKELLEHLLSQAKEYSPIDIQLTSKPARVAANKLYQSLGFIRKETNVYKIQL